MLLGRGCGAQSAGRLFGDLRHGAYGRRGSEELAVGCVAGTLHRMQLSDVEQLLDLAWPLGPDEQVGIVARAEHLSLTLLRPDDCVRCCFLSQQFLMLQGEGRGPAAHD